MKRRFTGAADVFDFFTFRILNYRHRSITERIVRVPIQDLKDPSLAGQNAVAAAVAFIRIEADKEFPRTVEISVMGDHNKSPGSRYKVKGSGECLKEN